MPHAKKAGFPLLFSALTDKFGCSVDLFDDIRQAIAIIHCMNALKPYGCSSLPRFFSEAERLKTGSRFFRMEADCLRLVYEQLDACSI